MKKGPEFLESSWLMSEKLTVEVFQEACPVRTVNWIGKVSRANGRWKGDLEPVPSFQSRVHIHLQLHQPKREFGRIS